jgi:ATP-dependent helicase/nuclease subunit A
MRRASKQTDEGIPNGEPEAHFSPAPPLTDQQHRAVTTRQVSVVLSSGAGCGKTHVLTERYLSHLRDDAAEVGQIVAITFTERAAREMRGRIRRAVVGHLRASNPGKEAENWSRHLRALETAPINTIHSFCGTLLRQHAVAAGIDPRFDVLEEVLSVNLEEEARAACLQRLLTVPGGVGEDLRQLVLVYGWRPVVEAISGLMRSWDAQGWRAWLDRKDEEIIGDWKALDRDVLIPARLGLLLQVRPSIARCLALLRSHPPCPGPMTDQVRFILEQTPRLADVDKPAALLDELHEAAKVGRAGAKAWPDAAVYEEIKEALQRFREELKLQREKLPSEEPEGLGEALAVGRRFLRVAREAVAAYAERKRLHGVVDFQDLLVLARDLLRDHPEVRASLQDRYCFLLIDELQDTDPVQMELAELLCGGGLSAGMLFAVGDQNQSIYRFRGANVGLFRDLRRTVPHEGRQGLTLNFRSQPALLHFANALLCHRLVDFQPLRASNPQINPEPCVEFLWAPRAEKATVAEGRMAEAEWIAQRIACLVDGPPLVVDRDGDPTRLRPARRGDVVLLFRAMTNVHLYEAALRQYGLDYYLVGGRAFFAQQEIYDVLNLLRALENPQDSVSLAGTLRSPFCCLSDEALFVLGRERNGLWAGLLDAASDERLPASQREPVRRARHNLPRWRGLKDRLSIADLLHAVFADSGYDAATQFESLADRKLANLWKLIDLARTFDRSGLFGLADFIARLGDLVRNQPREEQAATQSENADVVRLMTIHQAKGLEFPIVIVPDVAASGGPPAQPVAQWDVRLGCVVRPPADEEEPPFSDFGWRLRQTRESLEEWQEDLRTLYVACTRARDYLVLSAALPENYRPTNAWMTTLAERFDLTDGRCLAHDVADQERPRVTVFDRLNPPPAPSRLDQPLSRGMALELEEGAEFFAGPVEPSTSEKRSFTVEEVDDLLRRQGTLFQEKTDTEFEPAEDREEERADQLPAERLVRTVLLHWDFAETEGWHQALRLLAGRALNGPVAEAAAMLERFGSSTVRRALADAKKLLLDTEYSVKLTEELAAPLRVSGRIDCLWQDSRERWHVLFFTRNPLKADREARFRERLPGMALALEAVRRQTGDLPESLTLFSLADGGALRRASSRLSLRATLASVTAALTGLGRQPSPG